MEENTIKSVKKILKFKNGETLSIQISLENVSQNISKEIINDLLDHLFLQAKKLIA